MRQIPFGIAGQGLTCAANTTNVVSLQQIPPYPAVTVKSGSAWYAGPLCSFRTTRIEQPIFADALRCARANCCSLKLKCVCRPVEDHIPTRIRVCQMHNRPPFTEGRERLGGDMPPDAPRGLKFSFNPSLEHPGNLRYTPLSKQGLGKGSRFAKNAAGSRLAQFRARPPALYFVACFQPFS